MSDQEVLRQFLVSIGYKVDGSSEARLKQSVEGVTKQVTALALGIEAMVAAAFVGTAKVAGTFDQLYYASQRSGSSVAALQSFGFAFSQIGGSAQGAQSAVDRFASAMRNPGLRSWARSLGVKEGTDSVDGLITVVQRLHKQWGSIGNDFTGQKIAARFGISEEDYRRLSNPSNVADIQKWRQTQLDTNKALGFNPDQAAKSARDFEQSLGNLENTLTTLTQTIFTNFEPAFQKKLDALNGWILSHKDEITAVIGSIGTAVETIGDKISDAISDVKPLWDGFDRLAKSLGQGGAVQLGFEAFAVYLGGAWLTKILGVFGRLTAAAPPWLMFLMAGMSTFGMDAPKLPTANWAETLHNWLSSPFGGLGAPQYTDGAKPGEGTAPAAGDTRTWWQRHAPTWAGGKADPVAAAGGTPPTNDAMLNLIARAEGTDKGRGYNETLGYGQYTGGPVDLTNMTIDQVMALQRQMKAAGATTAQPVGRYQILRSTMRSLVQELGLTGSEKFDKAMQDRMALALLNRRGRSPASLRNEWDSFHRVSDAEILSAWDEHVRQTAAANAPRPPSTSNDAPTLPGSLPPTGPQPVLRRPPPGTSPFQQPAHPHTPTPAHALARKLNDAAQAAVDQFGAFTTPPGTPQQELDRFMLQHSPLAQQPAPAAPTLHQTTNVTVNGATDPHAVAKAITDHQQRAGRRMMYGGQGATQ